MPKAISTPNNLSAQATCLRNSGLEFVFRYYSANAWKRMERPESVALAAAGLKIAVVYEDGPVEENANGYFTAQRGSRHGRVAYQWASDVIHQPADSAIYFAVDFDYTDQANLAGIKAYFQAVRDAIAQESGHDGALDYKIGVYGSGKVCRLIKEQSALAEYSWLAESTGWTGYNGYKNACDVLQAIRTGSVCHLDNYEDCEARSADYGAFTVATDTLDPHLLELAGLKMEAGPIAVKTGAKDSGRFRVQPADLIGERGDDESTPALANLILADSRIAMATTHSSGVSDQANAKQNMLDTSAGQAARRSNYGNAPGGTVFLADRLLRGLLGLAETFSFQVTEFCGGSHSGNSRHYAGVAMDVNELNGRHIDSDHPNVREFKQACRNLGATEVLGPGDPGHSTHVHAAWPRPA